MYEKPLQCFKVISLQLIKINEKKKKKRVGHDWVTELNWMSPSGAEVFVVFLPGWVLCQEHKYWSWTPFSGFFPCGVPLSLTQLLASLGQVCLSACSYTWPLDSSQSLVLPKLFCAFPRSCCYSVIKSCQILCNPMDCTTPGFLSFTRVCWNSCPLIWWYHPTISSSVAPLLLMPSIFPSIRVFSNHSALQIRWPKYRSFSFSTSPSNEYSGLISFRVDWFGCLFQGTLKSLLQHHNSKASILQRSAFFMAQLSHLYMTMEKP